MKTTAGIIFSVNVCLFGLPAYADLNVYLSPPEVQTSYFATDTVNFNTTPTGPVNGASTPIGTYSGNGIIFENDQYGGSPDQERYLAVSSGDSVTIDLDTQPLVIGKTDAFYFGLLFTAGDGFNTFEIKSNGVTLQSFTTQALLDLIPNTPGSTVTSVDGQTYQTQNYYGQPGSGGSINGGEPYAYLNIVGTGGTTFDQIVISQGSGARFESDNHSISTTAIDTGSINFGKLVDVTTAVPETTGSGLALSALGLLALRRRRA